MSSKAIRVPKDEGNKLLGKPVDILVGDEQEAYGVHEELVRASSSFFDKAMAGQWKESLQRAIRLPDDEPKIFALYVHWVYYGTLPVFCDEPGSPGNSEYLDLVKAYVLGDKLLDSGFQNIAIDAIIEKSNSKAKDGKFWFPVGEVIEYVYGNTNWSAPIRELLVGMYAYHGHSEWLRGWGEPKNIPQPFLLQVASRLFDQRSGSGGSLKASKYHINDSDDENGQKNLPSLTNDLLPARVKLNISHIGLDSRGVMIVESSQ